MKSKNSAVEFLSDLPILPGDVSRIVAGASQLYIHNTPCVAQLRFPPRFKKTTRTLANTLGGFYSTKTFAVPAKFRIKEPGCTIMLFNSGDAVIVGARCHMYAALATRKLANLIASKFNISVGVVNIRRTNTMGTFYMGRNVNLNKALRHLPYAVYNPQIIKHLRFGFRDLGVTALISDFGRVVLTGNQSPDVTEIARVRLAEFLAHFVT